MFAHIRVLIMALMTAGPVYAQAPAATPAKPVKMVVLGDSLSAGYGLPAPAAFPIRLQKALSDKGIKVDMINAGVSGDTTSGGRDRLDWSIPEGTEAVIVELGANDALRGVDPAVTRAALSDILTRLKARKVAVLLCGMLAPPNYGSDYAARFNAIYPELSKSFDVPLYPFFLEGVAADARLNQADGMHPTAEGIDVIVKNILPDSLHHPLEFGLQFDQRPARLDGGDHRPRFLAAETLQALYLDLERLAVDPKQHRGDLVRRHAVDVADEAQGDVIIFGIDPACAGQAATQIGEGLANLGRNFQSSEQTRHRKILDAKALAH